MLASSQRETWLLSYTVTHWLGANQESTLNYINPLWTFNLSSASMQHNLIISVLANAITVPLNHGQAKCWPKYVYVFFTFSIVIDYTVMPLWKGQIKSSEISCHYRVLNILMGLKPEYSEQISSISWLPIYWLMASSGLWRSQYWPCKTDISSRLWRKILRFNYDLSLATKNQPEISTGTPLAPFTNMV